MKAREVRPSQFACQVVCSNKKLEARLIFSNLSNYVPRTSPFDDAIALTTDQIPDVHDWLAIIKTFRSMVNVLALVYTAKF